MVPNRSVMTVLDHDFLEIRARILDVAASLDRLDRASEPPGTHHPDRRLAQIRLALEALSIPEPTRAETIQRIFSLDYDPAWREALKVGTRERR
jgi:hypothetical protein